MVWKVLGVKRNAWKTVKWSWWSKKHLLGIDREIIRGIIKQNIIAWAIIEGVGKRIT